METRYEVMFENGVYHFRLVANGEVVFRGTDVATRALALTAADTARGVVIAGITTATPGDIVSTVTSRALAEAAAAKIIDLSAGISDDKGGTA